MLAEIAELRVGNHPRKHDDGIGRYYKEKEREARELSKQLADARAAGAAEKTIRELEDALERARYVGD